jgi:NUDIX domain
MMVKYSTLSIIQQQSFAVRAVKRHYLQICNCNTNTLAIGNYYDTLYTKNEVQSVKNVHKSFFARTTATNSSNLSTRVLRNFSTSNVNNTNTKGYGRIWKASSLASERSTTSAHEWTNEIDKKTPKKETPQYWTNRIIDSSENESNHNIKHTNDVDSDFMLNNILDEGDEIASLVSDDKDEEEDIVNFDDDSADVNIKGLEISSEHTIINHRESDFVLFPSTTILTENYNNTTADKTNPGNIIPTLNEDNSSSNLNTSNRHIDTIIQRIVESQRGEMRQRGLGVLHVDPVIDIQLLTDNYTVKAVASALRDREDALQQAALLSNNNQIQELQKFLEIFHPKFVLERRKQTKRIPTGTPNSSNTTTAADSTKSNSGANLSSNTTTTNSTITNMNDPITSLQYLESRNVIRKALMRMPRTVSTAHSKRAGVCIALCTVTNKNNDTISSILLERRALHMRNFPGEVCLPGGMVCDIQDQTIVSTSIREMKEEIYGLEDNTNDSNTNTNNSIEVLGVLRLNWGEVQYLTGVAVTPVVCYLGELPNTLYPNPNEVSEIFTIPLVDLLNQQYWIHRPGLAPIFIGGPYAIWGLTGYILERLAKDILRPSSLK